MKYIYIPDSIREDKIMKTFKSEEEYVGYQFKYRNILETIILQFIRHDKRTGRIVVGYILGAICAFICILSISGVFA